MNPQLIAAIGVGAFLGALVTAAVSAWIAWRQRKYDADQRGREREHQLEMQRTEDRWRSRDARLERLRSEFSRMVRAVHELVDVAHEIQVCRTSVGEGWMGVAELPVRAKSDWAPRVRSAGEAFAAAQASLALDDVGDLIATQAWALHLVIKAKVDQIELIDGTSEAETNGAGTEKLSAQLLQLVSKAKEVLSEIQAGGSGFLVSPAEAEEELRRLEEERRGHQPAGPPAAGGIAEGRQQTAPGGRNKRTRDSYLRAYLDGLTISLPAFAAVAAIGTVGIYLGGGAAVSGVSSLLWACGLAAGVWLLLGLPVQPVLSPAGANNYEFDQLTQRNKQLWSRLDQQTAADRVEASTLAPPREDLFSGRGLQWAGGNGYLTLWTKIHEAEEALLLVLPAEVLLAEAGRDLMRLKGSKMGQAEDLTRSLTGAVQVINRAASQLHLILVSRSELVEIEDSIPQSHARWTIRNVRQAINEYRESLWEGIVRARNQLFLTLIATVALAFLVVAVVVIRETDRRMVFVAVVLFLVGALIGGLFTRLRRLVSTTNLEEDFGLDTAHLLAAPILSGIAAVAGVLLVGLLHLSIGNVTIGAPSGATPGSSLNAILSFGDNPGALVIAALFGVTPALLVSYLQTQADQFSKGLSSSEAWGTTDSGPAKSEGSSAASTGTKPPVKNVAG